MNATEKPNSKIETRETPPEAAPIDVRGIPLAIVPIDKLLSMPFQSRTTSDPELGELVESIRTYGVLEPIIARPGQSGRFEVVAGQRRLRAAKEAGLTDIPIVIKTLTDQEACEVQLIENVQRKDLVDVEKARMLDYMIKQHGYTQEQLAKKIGKSREWIANHVRMLQLDNIVSRETMEKMTEGLARQILATPKETRKQIVKRIEETGELPSIREVCRAAQPRFMPCDRHAPTETIPEILPSPVSEAPAPKLYEKKKCPMELLLEEIQKKLPVKRDDQLDSKNCVLKEPCKAAMHPLENFAKSIVEAKI